MTVLWETAGFAQQSEVGNLEVAVDDAVGVEVMDREDQLREVEPRLRLQERRMILQHCVHKVCLVFSDSSSGFGVLFGVTHRVLLFRD